MDFYYMRNIRNQDASYLKNVQQNVVDVLILDYGKYIQIDTVIHRKKRPWQKRTPSDLQTLYYC